MLAEFAEIPCLGTVFQALVDLVAKSVPRNLERTLSNDFAGRLPLRCHVVGALEDGTLKLVATGIRLVSIECSERDLLTQIVGDTLGEFGKPDALVPQAFCPTLDASPSNAAVATVSIKIIDRISEERRVKII